MRCRGIAVAILCLALPLCCLAQASNSSRAEILRGLIAEEGAARLDMPLGGEGVRLSSSGEIDQKALHKQLQKNGRSVQSGRIVKVTAIEFDSKSIDIELDGGGKEKKKFGGHVQVGIGGNSTSAPQAPSAPKANGSKVSLRFAGKVPSDISLVRLKLLLAPVMDFTKQTTGATSVESLPPEFREAVLAKEARIGMDQDTVLLAMGRPNRRTSEKVDGVEQEEWQYDGRGVRKTFVTFENNVVVRVTEY
jgi:hypothetical protein